MSNPGLPSMLIHPGEILKDELQARHLSQRKFAEILDIPYTMLNEILNGKRPVSANFALMLEAALGIRAYIWNNLQADYNLQKAGKDKSILARVESIRRVSAAALL
jgi:addiction module HigA family antidote